MQNPMLVSPVGERHGTKPVVSVVSWYGPACLCTREHAECGHATEEICSAKQILKKKEGFAVAHNVKGVGNRYLFPHAQDVDVYEQARSFDVGVGVGVGVGMYCLCSYQWPWCRRQ